MSSEKIAQERDQRPVGRRHRVFFELGRIDPGEGLALARLRCALPAAAEIERHHQMERFVAVRGEGEGGDIRRADGDAEFFIEFADQGGFGRFARREFAAGKLPEAGEFFAGGAAGEQDFAALVDQSTRGDQQEGLRIVGRRGGLGCGVAEGDIFAGDREMAHRLADAGAADEFFMTGAGFGEAGAAEHGERGGVVIGHGRDHAVHAKLGEAPAEQMQHRLPAMPPAPGAPGDPVAEGGVLARFVEPQAGAADHGLGAIGAWLIGDGELVGAAGGAVGHGGVNPVAREGRRVGKRCFGQKAADFPIVDQKVKPRGIARLDQA